MEEWMPITGGKRPRSPVEKLAGLQGAADDGDEAHWRSSKRYFTEVIASGFSKLNFGRSLQQSFDQQAGAGQLPSPRAQRTSGSGCLQQLNCSQFLTREGSPCDMDTQESPKGWRAGQLLSPRAHHLHHPPALANMFTGLATQSYAPSCSHKTVQFPFGSYPPEGAASAPGQGPAAAGHIGHTSILSAKALKAVDKPPRSPSDLCSAGSNLRKVALLRSLLVRAEQHLQHEAHGQQQQQHQQHDKHPQALDVHSTRQHMPHQQHQASHESTATPSASAAGSLPSQQHPGQMQHCEQQHSHASVAQTIAPQSCLPSVSEDMECSSGSMADIGSSSAQAMASAGRCRSDLAPSSVLCSELLPSNSASGASLSQQQQQCQQQSNSYQDCSSLPLAQQQPAQHSAWGHLPHSVGSHTSQLQHAEHVPPQQQQQRASFPGAWPNVQQQYQQQHHQGQQQQQQQLHVRVQSPELSLVRLEALRAKALASTSNLTDLEPEDLHSLQKGITASQARRAYVDHTPSCLHNGNMPEPRRRSSHI